MTAARKTVAVFIALLFVLGIVTVLGYLILNAMQDRGWVSSSNGAAPYWTEDDARRVIAVQYRKRVPPAQIPWILNVDDPENTLVKLASLPWIANRPQPGETGGPAPSAKDLGLANLPTAFPRRVAVDEPIEVKLPESLLPWKPQSPGDHPVSVPEAYMPHLRRKFIVDKPEPAKLLEARIPWVRPIGQIEEAHITRAHVPPPRLFEALISSDAPAIKLDPNPATKPVQAPTTAATQPASQPTPVPRRPAATVPSTRPTTQPVK